MPMESSLTLDWRVTKKCFNKNGVNTLITMGTEPKKGNAWSKEIYGSYKQNTDWRVYYLHLLGRTVSMLCGDLNTIKQVF